MKFFADGGWWLPDHEEHLQQWMNTVGDRRNGRLLYQGAKYRMALEHTARRRVAVDVGAHVGLWSWQMVQDFDRVVAFEPITDHRACWAQNIEFHSRARMLPFALGDRGGQVMVKCRTPGSSGDTGVDPVAEMSSLRASIDAEGEPAHLCRLDDFEFEVVDFIKIDCEGYELFVLRGAVETLKRCRPCVIVEQKPETGMEARYGVGPTDAVTFLEALGAKRRAAKQGDYVLSWD